MAMVTDFVEWLANDARPSWGRGGNGPRSRRQTARPPRAGPRPIQRQPRASAAPSAGPGTGEPTGDLRQPRILQARRVIGASIFDASGEKAGQITDLAIDKQTGEIVYALIGVGGGLGFLRRLYAAPWKLLRYDARLGGYVAPAERTDLETGPTLTPENLRRLGAGDEAWRDRLAIYYSPYLTVPFI